MNPVISKCPVCGEELSVTRLDCAHCGTEIGGHFSLGWLYRLSPEDVRFVEMFVKNRGNAYRVGEELEMPYSAVRSRLSEIIRQMGYEPSAEPREEPGASLDRRRAVLDDLAGGKISSEEAIKMLQAEAA